MSAPEYTTKSGETIVIDEARAADAAAMLDYVEQISGESDFLGFGPGEFGITLEEEEGILEDYHTANNKLFLLARMKGEIIGNLSFEAGGRPRLAHCGGIGMGVRKEHWGEGIGSALLDELVRWCREGVIVKKINLRVRTDNGRAIHLYKKKGFVLEGTITKDTCVDGRYFDHHLMGLQL